MSSNLLYFLGSMAQRLVSHSGGLAVLAGQTFYLTFKSPISLKPVAQQMDYIGIRSLLIVSLTALFTGMVIGLQSAYALGRFGAKAYMGGAVALGVVREIGPVLTALAVGGRVGSGIAAELGSMNVTEQIDAMRAMGENPIKGLVVPRVVASVLALPLLTVVADVLGILGGLIVSLLEVERSFYLYLGSVRDTVVISDVTSGIFKTFFFGFIISVVGCYQGLSARGGTRGVGAATTVSVVISFLLILIADFFLTKLFLVF